MSLFSVSGLELVLCFRSFMLVALAAVNTAGTKVASVQNERDWDFERRNEKPEARNSSFVFPSPHACLTTKYGCVFMPELRPSPGYKNGAPERGLISK